MADNSEERRQKDLRDFEFYSKRVRPTASDLWRTNELSRKNNKISAHADKLGERGREFQGSHAPASLAEIYADRRYGTDRSDSTDPGAAISASRAEIVWLALAAAVVLLAGWSGSTQRVIEAIVF